MSSRFPDSRTIHAVLLLATRAPSIHNSQPWRWKVGDESLRLYADPGRHLPNTDPDSRDLLLSCGASLHHAVVALADLTSPVGAFVRVACLREAGQEVPVKELYQAWRQWSKDHGRDRPTTEQVFGRDLRAVLPGLKVRQPREGEQRHRSYEGVALTPEYARYMASLREPPPPTESADHNGSDRVPSRAKPPERGGTRSAPMWSAPDEGWTFDHPHQPCIVCDVPAAPRYRGEPLHLGCATADQQPATSALAPGTVGVSYEQVAVRGQSDAGGLHEVGTRVGSGLRSRIVETDDPSGAVLGRAAGVEVGDEDVRRRGPRRIGCRHDQSQDHSEQQQVAQHDAASEMASHDHPLSTGSSVYSTHSVRFLPALLELGLPIGRAVYPNCPMNRNRDEPRD